MYYIKKVRQVEVIESVVISKEVATKKVTYSLLCNFIKDQTKGEVVLSKGCSYENYVSLVENISEYSIIDSPSYPFGMYVLFLDTLEGIKVEIRVTTEKIALVKK